MTEEGGKQKENTSITLFLLKPVEHIFPFAPGSSVTQHGTGL